MLSELSNPCYQHLLINHLPIVGLAFAVIALCGALVIRNRPSQRLALGLVVIASASIWAVNRTGHEAYEEMRRYVDDPGADWMDAHMDRAEAAESAYYALAVLALVASLIPQKWPRTALSLTIGSLVLGLVCVGLSGWIAKAGGQIRHSEVRQGEPPRR
jgi:hypothetical protein